MQDLKLQITYHIRQRFFNFFFINNENRCLSLHYFFKKRKSMPFFKYFLNKIFIFSKLILFIFKKKGIRRLASDFF